MNRLSGFQRKYLRGLAHGLRPVVFVGQKGITDSVSLSIDEALDTHELIKLRFVDLKDKVQKKRAEALITERNNCEIVGRIGHVLVLFRPHSDPEKRKIAVPEKKAAGGNPGKI
ncbi:MAG: YhbY family RNA-binding protein [Desulfobacterales bacterium]